MDFTGKSVVVTGAASGIGLGLAQEAAARGMRVVLADRDAAALTRVSSEIEGAIAVPTDVTDPDAVTALADAAYAAFGRVDLLFNNAGVMATGLTWEIEPRRWEQSLAVNVGGVLNGLRAFVPRMIAQGDASRIINTASVGGFLPSPLMSPYSATKFAVVALTESLRGELEMLGAPVKASLLAPGPVQSGIFDDPFGAVVNPATQEFVVMLRKMLGEHGMTGRAFAAAVYEAIARDEYWIFPQPEAIDASLAARTDMILKRSTPVLRTS